MGNEAINNTNTILDTSVNAGQNSDPQINFATSASEPEQPIETKPSISSLNDIQAIPEFQDNYKKNKIIALISIAVGVIILVATALYYYMGNNTSDTATTQTTDTIAVEQTQQQTSQQPEMQEEATVGVLSSDPVISEINADLNGSESENIDKTTDDLEGFDFENIDLELQQNPGL